MTEIGDIANLSVDINVNGHLLNQVLPMKHGNGYSGYIKTFSHIHRFNMHNVKTTVQEGETPCKIGYNRDKSETSVDVQRQNHVEPQHKRNISAKPASQPDDLKLDGRIYTEKRHKCDLCNYSTKTPGALKTHKLIHTGKKPFRCDLCDYSTAQSGALKVHKLIHTGEKPYKCDLCDYSTTTSGDLNTHKLIHSGVKPYKCDLCDYTATQAGNFRRHQLIHTGEKPYKCNLCNFSSKKSGALKVHKLIHTGETFQVWFMWL